MANEATNLTIRESSHILSNLEHLTGNLICKPTNDYMFRAVLQKNQKALKGLVSVLLKISLKEIETIEILNPIVLGEALDDKTVILDLNILLNNNQKLNLEMQVVNKQDWPERSLYYLARNFSTLEAGKEYSMIKPCIHVGILDFTPFPDDPHFFAEYKMCNLKSGKVYSDKLTIYMLDLKQIDNVTDEEKESDLYLWAKFFKSTTWEEVIQLAKQDTSISEFTFTLHEMSEDEKIRQQCLARDMYNYDWIISMEFHKQLAREEGLKEGMEEGLQKGLQEGLQEGLKEGRQKGLQEGLNKGKNQKTRSIVTNMLKRNMSDVDICALAECNQELVDEIRKSLK